MSHKTRLVLLLQVEMPPPAKRRRGLAGSIVSTALSAALIGTAVGLTVYRLYALYNLAAPFSPYSPIFLIAGEIAVKKPNDYLPHHHINKGSGHPRRQPLPHFS